MKERVSVCKKVSEKERESERERERSVCLRNGEREKVFCTYKNDGMSCCTFLFCLRIFFYGQKSLERKANKTEMKAVVGVEAETGTKWLSANGQSFKRSTNYNTR